jgi:hypothetical protein
MRASVFVKTRRDQVIDNASAIYVSALALILSGHVLGVLVIPAPYVGYLSQWTALNALVFVVKTLRMKNPFPLQKCPREGCDELLDPRVSLHCPIHGQVSPKRST